MSLFVRVDARADLLAPLLGLDVAGGVVLAKRNHVRLFRSQTKVKRSSAVSPGGV